MPLQLHLLSRSSLASLEAAKKRKRETAAIRLRILARLGTPPRTPEARVRSPLKRGSYLLLIACAHKLTA